MKNWRYTGICLLGLVLLACSGSPSNPTITPGGTGAGLAGVDGQGPNNSPSTATMQFGQQGHVDAHAAATALDNLVPRTVTIQTGGTVTFKAPPSVHQIAIYKPGTEPEDINSMNLTTLNAFAGCTSAIPEADAFFKNVPIVINDNTNRETTLPVPCLTPTERQYTFKTPGRYLVICAFLPHFNIQMYGWVIVKD